jgi:hypothetical protein
MGVGYYRNFTVWHNGPNPYGCNSSQNDLEIIAGAYNGFGYRTDDHGEAKNSASTVAFSSNQFTASGVIEETDDKDLFKMVLQKRGRLQLDAVPTNVGTGNTGSNLDLQVQLISSSNDVLSTYNPGTLLSSIADTVMEAGTYYLSLDGKGNSYASEYGSLGSYSILGTFTELAPLPLRRLELKGSTENVKHKLDWIIDADEQVTKQTVEVSNNGRDFQPAGSPANASRSFAYSPAAAGMLQYRLHVFFDDGRDHYSNTVQLRSSKAQLKPQIMGNMASGSLQVLSPVLFNYSVYDATGRMMITGQLKTGNNEVNISNLNRGVYLIQFSNNNEQTTERFIKE